MATATKTARDLEYQALYDRADQAGRAAAEAMVPTPMIVGSPSTPLGSDIDLTKEMWLIDDGVCGFAWVTLNPATTSFARWLKAKGYFSKSYSGGLSLWVSGYGQSMQRKEAYARAFAAVLRDAGYESYGCSRMD